MKKIVNSVIFASLLSMFSIACAQFSASAGYSSYGSTSVGLVYGSAGYQYTHGDFTFMPELRIGFGTGGLTIPNLVDDVISDFTLEIDNVVAVSVRAQYHINDYVGVFLQPSYIRTEQTFSGNDVAFNSSGNTSDFDVGIGATLSLSEEISLEAFWNDSTSLGNPISVGVRYSF